MDSSKFIEEQQIKAFEEQLGLDVWKDHRRKPTFHNAVALIEYDPEVKDVFQYNRFSSIDEVSKRPPWGTYGDYPRRINDMDIIALKFHLRKKYQVEFTKNILDEAVTHISMNKSYDPMYDYLISLKWDGKSRVENWLHTYLGADDNRYTRYIGSMTLVAACARIVKPGIKYDYMLILDGEQGIGKSMAIRALGGEFYREISLTDRTKETIENMQGAWLIEVAEMAVFGKKDIQSLKNFITIGTDVTRLPYLRRSNDYPRRNIFIGTINPDNSGYLTDSTGNRRFFPVDCTTIDVPGITKDRDQLIAEAYQLFKDGHPLYIKDNEILRDAINAQCNKEFSDSWLEPIKEHLVMKDTTTTTKIWMDCLRGSAADIKKTDQVRINNVMRKLGWEHKTTRIDGVPTRAWKKPYVSSVDIDKTDNVTGGKPEDLLWDEEN